MLCRMADGGAYSDATREVVSQMLSDHLFDELRANEGITYGAYAFQQTFAGGTGVFGTGGLIQNSGVGIAAKTFRKVSEDAAAGNFPMNRLGATRLNKAREYGLGQQAMSDLSMWFAEVAGRNLDWKYRTEYADRLATTGLEDMKALMEPCPESQVITMVGPVDVIKKVLDEDGLAYEEFDRESRALALLDQHNKREARKYRKAIEKRKEREAKKAAEDKDDSDEG